MNHSLRFLELRLRVSRRPHATGYAASAVSGSSDAYNRPQPLRKTNNAPHPALAPPPGCARAAASNRGFRCAFVDHILRRLRLYSRHAAAVMAAEARHRSHLHPRHQPFRFRPLQPVPRLQRRAAWAASILRKTTSLISGKWQQQAHFTGTHPISQLFTRSSHSRPLCKVIAHH